MFSRDRISIGGGGGAFSPTVAIRLRHTGPVCTFTGTRSDFKRSNVVLNIRFKTLIGINDLSSVIIVTYLLYIYNRLWFLFFTPHFPLLSGRNSFALGFWETIALSGEPVSAKSDTIYSDDSDARMSSPRLGRGGGGGWRATDRTGRAGDRRWCRC